MDMPTLEQAVIWTVAYADIFDYPMTAQEIHWFLWGMPASESEIADLLCGGLLPPGTLSSVSAQGDEPAMPYYTLPGREHLVAVRQRRRRIARRLWERAWAYAAAIASLPFVRMVALTGSLAAGNTEAGADIDYLIVTAPGRLWLCRAGVIGIGRLAARRGDTVCPNYILAENSLSLRERNLYTAREFAQMVPLYGLDVYRRLRAENPWVNAYLPNARGQPCLAPLVYACRRVRHEAHLAAFTRALESLMMTPPCDWLERWEMRRKIRKFNRQREFHPESAFSADWCKGHFNDHMTRTLQQFALRARVAAVEEPDNWIAQADALALA